MESSKASIITFANIKGGVGKTTAVVNLAYLLATELGKRVLVVDSDDQGNASKALGVRSFDDDQERNLWTALENKLGYKRVMIESPYEGIAVIPSTKELKSAQRAFGQSARGMKMFRRLLKGVERDFDYVLIDTKPQINILLQAALVASDWYVVPSFPESDSYDGFVDLISECEEIYEEENEDLNCLGVLFTNYKKSPAHEAYIEFIGKHLKKAKVPVFKTKIRHSNSVATGSLHSCPAVSMSSSRNTSDDYLEVARQLNRMASGKNNPQRPVLEVLGISEDSQGTSLFNIVEAHHQEIRF